MLRILDRDKAPVKGLRVYKDLCIESALDLDDKTLSFSAPLRNVRGSIVPECYIETKEDRFVVKEVTRSTDGTVKVTAVLDMETLEGKSFRSFKTTEQTIQAALQLAFAGTGWTIAESQISKKRTLSMSNVSALDILKQAVKTYRVELKVDSKNQQISIYENVGEDKGVYFTTQLNLRKLEVQSTSYDFYTELEPYGNDGLTIESVNNGKTYVENHQYSNKTKRYIWKDERYTLPESLKEDAEAKLADMSRPYSSYNADVLDLSRASSGKYAILAYKIGDTVTLMDGITGTREKQRIVGMKRYPEEPSRDTCTLANKVLTFDELAQKYEETSSTVDNITNDNGQIDGDTIDGIYSRQVVDLENAIINSATIVDLTAQYLQVTGKLTAVEADIGTLNTNVANIDHALIGKLDADKAEITYAKITDLDAANASINILEADSANIKSLLAGNAGVGDLQNIHLTSDNAVIDSALIRNAVMQTVTINDLLAGTISTNKFKIMSDDGAILISGATQQWKDKNGVVRMQAGLDVQGNFTFALFNAEGTGSLIDDEGIHPGAIADGLIVNDMVADDAAISGSKLDIDSVFAEMNGSTQVLNSSRIWLDEKKQTLNQVYAQMSQDIQTIKTGVTDIETGMDGIKVNISNMQTDIEGVTDGSLLYNVQYNDNGDHTATLTATVYKAGTDITKTFNDRWFSWYKKSEDGERFIGYGYSITVDKEDAGFGSTYIGRFATYEQRYLTTRTGRRLTTRNGNRFLVWTGD